MRVRGQGWGYLPCMPLVCFLSPPHRSCIPRLPRRLHRSACTRNSIHVVIACRSSTAGNKHMPRLECQGRSGTGKETSLQYSSLDLEQQGRHVKYSNDAPLRTPSLRAAPLPTLLWYYIIGASLVTTGSTSARQQTRHKSANRDSRQRGHGRLHGFARGRGDGRNEVPRVGQQLAGPLAECGPGNVSLSVLAADEHRHLEQAVALGLSWQWSVRAAPDEV